MRLVALSAPLSGQRSNMNNLGFESARPTSREATAASFGDNDRILLIQKLWPLLLTLVVFKSAWRAVAYIKKGWWKSREGEGNFAVPLRKPSQPRSSRFDEKNRKERPRTKERVVSWSTVFHEEPAERNDYSPSLFNHARSNRGP